MYSCQGFDLSLSCAYTHVHAHMHAHTQAHTHSHTLLYEKEMSIEGGAFHSC